MIKVGSDFSGVGAFDQALKSLGIDYETVFACDMDKYARQTYIHNYGEPKYYPENVYDREIPIEPLDIYMTSPPCFVGETLINTSLGFKKIKDVKIGDFVLTHENRYQKVADFGTKISDIVILKAQGILDTKTTKNHRYYVREKSRKWNNEKRMYERIFSEPKWVEVKYLTKNHFIGINIPNISENKREIKKETAYVLGRYIADGWIRDRNDENGKTKGNAVVLAIGKDKIDYISEKIKLKHSLEKEVNGVSKLFIYSNSLVQLINNLQLGVGAINKRIPQEIINLPNNVLQSFVDGYMDGDGHSHKDYFRATSVSKELLMGLQLCIAKLYKVNANIKFVKTPETTVIQGRTVNQRDYYVLEFRKEMRKQSNAVVIEDKIWYPVKKILVQEEKELVFDITVENDHSFTANQAIVHNCQAFSLAGKRKGEDDKRGVLFYNSQEFIKQNKPRYFIFENVKGLLSDDNGKTFGKWIDLLGGKSVNGNQIMFPNEDSVPYHIYHKVLNAKNYGVPQNRERVFIIGIRDDADNKFNFPKPFPLTKRLKDVLEENVDEKYYLSDTAINVINNHERKVPYLTGKEKNTNTIISGYYKIPRDGQYIKVKSATSKGYELAEIGEDSINLEHPNSETRRGRVGKSVAQTLTTNCNQGVAENTIPKVAIIDDTYKNRNARVYNNIAPTIRSEREGLKVENNYRIRKLIPRECFRLMDFPEDFDFSVVSDSQAYKQAGNSIVVNVLAEIIKKLNL